MKDAIKLFEDAIGWLKSNYKKYRFFAERDIVWTVQQYLVEQIEKYNLPLHVFHNYPIEIDRQKIHPDLAILNNDNFVEVAIEFKYEPSRDRKLYDFLSTKFPVVLWKEVVKDIKRNQKIVEDKKANASYSIFIDEGGFFYSQQKTLPPGSEWINWDGDIWILYSEAFNIGNKL